jgi:hypothetical protein
VNIRYSAPPHRATWQTVLVNDPFCARSFGSRMWLGKSVLVYPGKMTVMRTFTREFMAKPIGDRQHCRFRAGVDCLALHHLPCGRRSSVNEMSAALLLEERQYCGYAVQHSLQTYVYSLHPVVHGKLCQRADGHRPALLMSTSSLPNFSLDIVIKPAKSSRLVTSVGRNATSPPDRSIWCRHCPQPLLNPRSQNNLRATTCEQLGCCLSDSTTGGASHLLSALLYLRLPQHLRITETLCRLSRVHQAL